MCTKTSLTAWVCYVCALATKATQGAGTLEAGAQTDESPGKKRKKTKKIHISRITSAMNRPNYEEKLHCTSNSKPTVVNVLSKRKSGGLIQLNCTPVVILLLWQCLVR